MSVTIEAERLRHICAQLLQRVGVPVRHADLVATVLVEADLRGVSTHGVFKLPRFIAQLRSGSTNPRPRLRVLRRGPGSALLDGGYGLGPVVSVKAMELCLELAQGSGLAAVGVRRSTDNGRQAYYAAMALDRDFIGFCTTTTPPLIAPPGGISRIVGNNPFGFAVPAGKEWPIVIDMAISASAASKVVMAQQEGQRLPEGWLLDRSGQPTDDPQQFTLGGGLLVPIGGAKGYALALMLEILAGALTGALLSRELQSLGTRGVGHFLLAINPEVFMPLDRFKERVDEVVRWNKGSALKEGSEGVRLPGEREWREREKQLREGIALSDTIWRGLEQAARELDLTGLLAE